MEDRLKIGITNTSYGVYGFEDAVDKAARIANVDLSKMCQSKTFTFLRKIKSLMTRQKNKYEHQVLNKSELDKYKKLPV